MANDWEIRVLEQIVLPPFLKYCAIARRTEGNFVREVNAEGDTRESARTAIIQRLQNMGLMNGRKG